MNAPLPGSPLGGPELAAFTAAVEAGSVHGAADALGLSQSAVTKRIQSLESRLRVRLLERGRFGVRPTAAGKALYPEAKRALGALRAAEEAVAAHLGETAATLRLAASFTIGEVLLPEWLAAFRRGHGDVRAQVEVVNSPRVLDAVRAGDADIGFCEGIDLLDDLLTLDVARDELAVIVSASHPWAELAVIEPAQLRQESYLSRESGSGTRAVAAAAFAKVGLELHPDLELASTESVKRALSGGGFAVMSRLVVQAEERAGDLRALPVAGVDLSRRLVAVRQADEPSRAAVGSFWDWIAARAA